ncbi:MAG: hypothetical protein HC913_03570 [Microscillaceae bacterium]|nr:hypothetical protein [Microscillaceae bacterium]
MFIADLKLMMDKFSLKACQIFLFETGIGEPVIWRKKLAKSRIIKIFVRKASKFARSRQRQAPHSRAWAKNENY